MKYLLAPPAPNSFDENYQILGSCDGYVYLNSTQPSCVVYRKRIFELFEWKKIKAFAELDKDEYSCVCCSLIPSQQSIVMLVESENQTITLCCYSLETGEMKTYQSTTNFEDSFPFDRAVYHFFFLDSFHLRCYPSKLCFDDDCFDFPFFIFSLDAQTSTFSHCIDFGLVFHDDFDDYQNISNLIFIDSSTILYQYVKNASQYYLKIDLSKLSPSQATSTPDDKGFVEVDGFSSAFKMYACETFYEHIHHHILVNKDAKIEFYNLDGYNGIIKGEIEFNDVNATCKEAYSKQIFYGGCLDLTAIPPESIFLDDTHIFISTSDYFITGYHMVKSLKDIAFLAFLPKIHPSKLSNLLCGFYQYFGFVKSDP